MAAQKLRAVRDLVYRNVLVRKGETFDYFGDKPHKYAVDVTVPEEAPHARKVVADLKPEAARKAAKQKAIDPTGDDSQA